MDNDYQLSKKELKKLNKRNFVGKINGKIMICAIYIAIIIGVISFVYGLFNFFQNINKIRTYEKTEAKVIVFVKDGYYYQKYKYNVDGKEYGIYLHIGSETKPLKLTRTIYYNPNNPKESIAGVFYDAVQHILFGLIFAFPIFLWKKNDYVVGSVLFSCCVFTYIFFGEVGNTLNPFEMMTKATLIIFEIALFVIFLIIMDYKFKIKQRILKKLNIETN